MKKKEKILFILSLSCFTSLVGFSSWAIAYNYAYTLSNKVQTIPVAYIIGKEDVKYTSIEKALEMAESGDIVCVIPPQLANYNDQTNAITPDKVVYRIQRNCTIKEGVTLFIPTDNASVSEVTNASSLQSYIESMKKSARDQGNSGYNSYAEKNESRFLRITIELDDGVILQNNGTLLISGYLGGGTSNSGCVGQTSHSYSQVVLNKDSSIIQGSDNACTYCFGFIKEQATNNNSIFDIQKGLLYIPCVINDYRGFTYSYAMTNGAIDTERCSAFNELEFRNITVFSKIHYEASVYGIFNIYVKYSTLGVDETITIEKEIVGKTDSFLIEQSDPLYSYITYKYNYAENTFEVKCYGGFVFNNLSIELSLKGQSLPLTTKNAFFPISYKFDVELLCGSGQENATYDISKQRMKIMTGAKIYVGDNVTLSGNELIVYSSFLDGSYGCGQNVSSPSRPTYPIKENGLLSVAPKGKMIFNKCAGTIFCDNSENISTTSTTITSKEPWTFGTSGSLIVPWTINNFLELSEELTIVPTEYINKMKICAGVNVFTNTNNYSPSYIIYINDKTSSIVISNFQKVIFLDDILNYSIDFINNIYSFYINKNLYSKRSIVTYNDTNKIICATNSNLEISNNNNGINEFDVQSISINGDTHTIELGTIMQLTGTINDINKSYVKKYTWSSLDTSIATVDQTGQVKGLGIGTTAIQLECDGVTQTYEINVVEPVSIIEGIESVAINESSGKSDGDTFKDGTYTFNANLLGENGSSLGLDDISKIEWSFQNISGSIGERVYFGEDSNNKAITASGNLSVKVTLAGGPAASSDFGATPDEMYVVCKVTDLKGKVVTSKFHIVNDNACLVEGTLILMADNSLKQVEDLKIGDVVKVFNHETGNIDVSPIIFITHKDEKASLYNVITLEFSNSISLKIVKNHALFNVELNKYILISNTNVKKYIGYHFAYILNDKIHITKLIGYTIDNIETRIYCPVSAFHMNLFANSLLTMPNLPFNIEGLYNIFKLDKDMKYNLNEKRKDILKYGLFTYEEFIKLANISREAFNVSPAIYLKISLGKGLITKEEIIFVVNFLLSKKLITR